jgi:D-xylose transport system permease protein
MSDTIAYLKKQIKENIQTYAIVLALALIWILFSFLTEGMYIGSRNISNLFRQMTVTSFLAIGMVLVIVTGNIDLSVGKLAGFVSVIVAKFQADIWFHLMPNIPILTTILSVLIGIGVGALFGAVQGYISSYFRIPSFIVTLGGMWILNGGILIVTGSKTIPANQPLFSVIAQGYLSQMAGWAFAAVMIGFLTFSMFQSRRNKAKYGFTVIPISLDIIKTLFFSAFIALYVYIVNQYNGVQIPVLIMALTTLAVSYVSTNTPVGRYSYAIGGNREAARLSGVNIKKNVFYVFVLMGIMAGFSGVVLASYVGFGTIGAGTGYELDAIASCYLGGTSAMGGIGTIFGALVGSLIMASLTNGLQMMNVPAAWQYVLKGIVLVTAVYTDVYLKKNR